MDLVARTFDCDLSAAGLTLTVDYSRTSASRGRPPTVPGPGTSLETHDNYVPENASPAQDDVALLTFGDGSKALAFVVSISDTTNLQLYQQPYPRMSISIDSITVSEWDAHPAGEVLTSLQRCYRDNALPPVEVFGVFANGWWSLATRRDAHARASVAPSTRSRPSCTRPTSRQRRGRPC